MKKLLYLGLTPPSFLPGKEITHCPLIKIIPRSREGIQIKEAYKHLDSYTHLLFTSQTSVRLFFDYARNDPFALSKITCKEFIAVGKKTAGEINHFGGLSIHVAKEETAEGVTSLLSTLDLTQSFLFWPRSALARPVISDWLESNNIRYTSCVFYDTAWQAPDPVPDLDSFDEIVFTSPSTACAFLEFFGRIPRNKTLTCIGPITQKKINSLLN